MTIWNIYSSSKKGKANEGGLGEYKVNYHCTDGQHLQMTIVSQKHIHSVVVAHSIEDIIQSRWFHWWWNISKYSNSYCHTYITNIHTRCYLFWWESKPYMTKRDTKQGAFKAWKLITKVLFPSPFGDGTGQTAAIYVNHNTNRSKDTN